MKTLLFILFIAISLTASLKNSMPSSYLQKFKDEVDRQENKYPDTFITQAGGDEKKAYLTFDDGPDALKTTKILKILKNERVRATFFFLGSGIKKNREIVKKAFDDGHVIASHGYTHIDFRKKSAEWIYREQILKSDREIMNITGKKHHFFRPPYGAITDKQIDFFKQKGYKIAVWSIDSFDWLKSSDEKKIAKEVIKNIHNGAIILMHSYQGLTEIIKELKKEGYEFDTLKGTWGF